MAGTPGGCDQGNIFEFVMGTSHTQYQTTPIIFLMSEKINIDFCLKTSDNIVGLWFQN